MILTTKEYSQLFKINGRYVHQHTVMNRCKKGLMPGHCEVRKVGRLWMIHVPDTWAVKADQKELLEMFNVPLETERGVIFTNLKEVKEGYHKQVIETELKKRKDELERD